MKAIDDHRGQAGGSGARVASVELRLNGAGIQDAAGAVVRSVATATGIQPPRVTRLRVVVEELVREASRRPRAVDGDDVVVRVRVDGGSLEVEVTDLALPVTASESRRAPSRRLAALGFVDELHIRSHGKAGNVARCVLALEPLETDLGGESLIEQDAPVVSEEEVQELEIRPMGPADAMGLVRCIYRCYGYSYKDSSLYEPRQIARALRDGSMHSVVAVAADGTVVGHSALFIERAGDPVPEAGKLVVDPRYRGHRLSEKMGEVRRRLAEDRGVAGYWAEAVTNHPGSQREIIRLAGAETGLLIGGSPAAVEMAGFDNPNEGRRTLLVMFTPVRRESREIHVGERHRELIAELAGRLGLDRTIAVAETGEPPADTQEHASLEVKVLPEAGLAHLRAETVGADLPSRVADELEGLDAFDLGAVHLDLPLCDPAAPWAADRLESLGFCFAAWLPGFLRSGDALRVQRVGTHPVDTEHVVCARAEGEALRDLVIAEWHRVRRAGIA